MNNTSVEIVLVLYKKMPQESKAFCDLLRHKSALENIGYNILLYNNSPELSIPENKEAKVINAQTNRMLAAAYNYALYDAKRQGIRWLLLLDQDTELTGEYFEEVAKFVTKGSGSVVAVPIVKQQGIHLSPIVYNTHTGPFLHFRKLTDDNVLSDKQCIVGFNSGVVLNVDFMVSIGGFSQHFPMDMLDYWYFLQIYRHHRKVKILPAVIEQRLSLMNIAEEMNTERYDGYIASLKLFAAQLGWRACLCLKVKLIKDIVFQALDKRKRKFIPSTIKALIIPQKETI